MDAFRTDAEFNPQIHAQTKLELEKAGVENPTADKLWLPTFGKVARDLFNAAPDSVKDRMKANAETENEEKRRGPSQEEILKEVTQ